MSPPVWEPVKDPGDRRRVVYWRLGTGKDREWVGAVSRRDQGWRALRYDYPSGKSAVNSTELGFYATKRRAQRAVEDAARAFADALVKERS